MTTTLKGMVSAFLSTRRLRNLSSNTITFYNQHLNKFLAFIESHYPDVTLEQIDHTILREYVSGLKENHSAGGVNHDIKVLKNFFRFMIEEGVITINDIQLDEKILTVKGKGGKGRVVPFGDRSLIGLVKYLNRRTTLFGKDGVLFLTKFGDPLTLRMVNKIIERIGSKARIENVRLSAHTFRHTFAKNWLLNGGDIFSLGICRFA